MYRTRGFAATNAHSVRPAPIPSRDAVRTAAANLSRDRAGREFPKEIPMLNDPIVIIGAARTPMGGMQGDFASLAASDLGAVAIKAAVERAGVRPDEVQEAIMGNVLPAGQGQAPARQAALKAGLPLSVVCTTVNKMCGSGMKAAMFAHDLIAAGSNDIIVAGGMESMTNAPYLMPKARSGHRMGHQIGQDPMFPDGLEDADEKGRLMGTFREGWAAQIE